MAHPTSEACDSLVLRTTDLLKFLRARTSANLSLTFSVDGEPFDLMLSLRMADGPHIELMHRSRVEKPSAERYRVDLAFTPQPFGGARWWFLCPETGRSAVKLYLPRGGRRFLSRGAYKLGYGCQREDRAYRAQRQAIKVYRDLGGQGNWRSDTPEKPKWMRWATYDRQVAKFDMHNERFDAALGGAMMRLLRRA